MAKNERGLPPGFALNVPKRPVDLGDYLDEEPPKRTIVFDRPAPVATQPPAPQQPLPEAPQIAIAATNSFPERAAQPAPVWTPPQMPRLERVSPKAQHPPRRQFNLNEDTLRLLDELLLQLQMQTGQRDVRASEVIHALVLAISEARPQLDVSRVPRRGQWGSATAAQFPLALKEAFRDAILRATRR